MKKLFVFVTFLLLPINFVNSQTGWQQIYPLPVHESIESSHFINENTGFFTSGNGIYKTTNSGNNWDKNFSDSGSFDGLFFFNDNTGWVTEYDDILKTTNAGLTWNKISTLTNESISKIQFLNENTGFIATYHGVYKTTNGGYNWIPKGPQYICHCVYFLNENTGFAGYGDFYKTTDGGNNWILISSTISVYDIAFVNSSTGFAGGYSGTILKTTNSGLNWFTSLSGFTSYITSFSFVDINTGWASGSEQGKLVKTTNCGVNWFQQNTYLYHSLEEIYFVNSNTGWIFTVYGEIYKTTNGGINFNTQSSSLFANFNAIFFTDNNTGYTAGYIDTLLLPLYNKGIAFKSTNGGLNWNRLNIPSNRYLYSIYFPNQITGYIGGSGGTVLRTTNEGLNWDTVNTSNSGFINDIYFINGNTGWVSSFNIYKTTNGGINWISQYTGNDMECMFFLNENTGFAGGYWTTFLKTTNGGNNWQPISFPYGFQSYITDIHFFDENTGLAISAGGLCKSTNGGLNWTLINSSSDFLRFAFKNNKGWMIDNYSIWQTTNYGTSWLRYLQSSYLPLYSIYFNDENTGWVAGRNSSMMKTTNGGVGIKNTNNNIPQDFSLFQNYPNPFNQSSIINFQCSITGNVNLKVFDIAGREITTLVNEILQSGTYQVMFDGCNLPSGVYFCRLQAGNFTEVRKMILTK